MTMSDSSEPRRIAMRLNGGTSTEQQQEQLPCPRCESTNTKFCYYNNYNFSQPRHFCKSCRRYWTQGGTLRDIPVGGGTRKPAKRSRTSSPSSLSVSSRPLQAATPLLLPPPTNGVTDSDSKGSALSLCGNFTSLFNHNAANANANATHGLVGFGFDDVSFGRVWPFSTVCDAVTTNVVTNGAHHGVTIPATWQFEGLENGNNNNNNNGGGFVSGEYFAWPDLSITTPGNSLK